MYLNLPFGGPLRDGIPHRTVTNKDQLNRPEPIRISGEDIDQVQVSFFWAKCGDDSNYRPLYRAGH